MMCYKECEFFLSYAEKYEDEQEPDYMGCCSHPSNINHETVVNDEYCQFKEEA